MMKALPVIKTQRPSLSGWVLSAFILLLLTWHVSFNVNPHETTYPGIGQNVVVVSDGFVEDHNFDWDVPVNTLISLKLSAENASFSAIYSLYPQQTFLPQSRAPPSPTLTY